MEAVGSTGSKYTSVRGAGVREGSGEGGAGRRELVSSRVVGGGLAQGRTR